MPHCGPCCAPHLLTILFISLSLSLQHQQHPSNENDFLVCTRRRVLWPLNRDRDGVCMRPVSVLVRSNKIMETPQKEKEDERMMMIFLFSQVLAFRPALIYLCVCVCVSSFIAADWLFFFFLRFLLQLGPNSGGPLSIHTHIIIHLKFGSALLPKGKLLNERERERERETSRELVCVSCFACGAFKFSPKKYSFFSLSLFLRISSICYDKLLLLHGASRVIKKRLERMKKKKGKMCAALNPPPPLSLLFTCC